MNEPLDEAYLTWLYSQVGSVRLKRKDLTYWSLLRQLFQKEFVWFVPNDDNRCADGHDLRYEFRDQMGEDPDPDWMDLPCSMLELLISLSRRLAFEGEGEPRWWFWHMIENLDLTYTDREYTRQIARKIDNRLDVVIQRTYSPTGRGGLFPLRHPRHDQREVELWYQLNAYLIEQLDE